MSQSNNTPNGAGGVAGATPDFSVDQQAALSHKIALDASKNRESTQYLARVRKRIADKDKEREDYLKEQADIRHKEIGDKKAHKQSCALQFATFALAELVVGSMDPNAFEKCNNFTDIDPNSILGRDIKANRMYTTYMIHLPNDRDRETGKLLPAEQRYFSGWNEQVLDNLNDIKFNDPSKNGFPIRMLVFGPPRNRDHPERPFGSEAFEKIGITPAITIIEQFLKPLGFTIFTRSRSIHITLVPEKYKNRMDRMKNKFNNFRSRQKTAPTQPTTLADYIN